MAMAANNNNPGYSTLEYDPTPTSGYGKEYLPPATVLPPDYSQKQAYIADNSGIEVAAGEAHHDPDHQEPRSRRKWLIIGAIVAVLIIIAAVVGGVLGSKGKKNSSEESTSSSATSGTSTSAISPSGTSSSLPTPTIAQKRNIAAVSFENKSVNQTRLYFQKNDGKLVESVPGGTTGRLLEFDTTAKKGTALAAAVSRPGFPLKISVFYTDAKNVIHDIIYESGKWADGDLSEKGYTTAPNGSLSAMYNQCRLCANTTILAFQDENNLIQIGNLTSTGWTLTQLAINQLENTGLALQPFYWAGFEDQLDLYYQRKDLKMAMASWISPDVTKKPPPWTPDQLWDVVPPNTPIATASSYHNVSSGIESWIQVLSVANTGVVVDTWDGERRNWILHANQHIAMSNISQVDSSYEAVAMTATGIAFGVLSKNGTDTIESWQLNDDYINWASTGVVDIGTAWK